MTVFLSFLSGTVFPWDLQPCPFSSEFLLLWCYWVDPFDSKFSVDTPLMLLDLTSLKHLLVVLSFRICLYNQFLRREVSVCLLPVGFSFFYITFIVVRAIATTKKLDLARSPLFGVECCLFGVSFGLFRVVHLLSHSCDQRVRLSRPLVFTFRSHMI
jgi:hypothetical protein